VRFFGFGTGFIFERFNKVFIDFYWLGDDTKSLFSDRFSINKELGQITLFSSSKRIPHFPTGIMSGLVSNPMP
jgi:hypothetical protein